MPIPNAANATWSAQAEPDSVDFDIVTAAHASYGVASGCACTPASSGSTLGVAVASGTVHVGSKTAVTVTGATVTPGAASGSNPRFDLIAIDNTGAIVVVAGTAAASPVFPAIPASRTIIAAVYIPTSATSITASNIVDKRQIVDYVPAFGTTSTTTARGDHLHAGKYASSIHADSHRADGADPITALGYIHMYPNDGTGVFEMNAQTSAPGALIDDSHLMVYPRWIGYRPVMSTRSMDREMPFGDAITGPENLFLVTPNTGTTLASAMLFLYAPGTITGVSTPTASHPTPTSVLGFRTKLATAATANSEWYISSTDLRWIRGDSALPWCGYYHHTRVAFEDASYANTGASTGVRFYTGFTDQALATMMNTDNPAGNRHGFQLVNVNGGKTQTTFQMTTKNGTTESLLDSGIAITQNHVYDFYIFMRPANGYAFGQVDDLTAGTSSGSMIDIAGNASIPAQTTFMRCMVGMKTINATARSASLHRTGAEIAA